MITCTRCDQAKPEDEFSPQKSKANGRHSWCKACYRDYRRAWTAANADRAAIHQRRYSLKVKYGVSLEEFERLLADQGGGCAVCGATTHDSRGFTLAVDHDHATGRVRGILCGHCNAAIGKLGDTVAGVGRALAYLQATS